MKLWRSMMNLPQPIKGCAVVYMVVFAVAFVSVPLLAFTGQEYALKVAPWTMGALGLCAVSSGLVLLFDVCGSARAYAAMMKDYKPLGVDYSKSIFSKPSFVRCFGGMFALVGTWFIVGSTTIGSRLS
jgi:hypothetical protein